MPGFPVHHQLPELAQTQVHRVSDAIQPSHPLLSLLLLPSVFPSIRIFSNESVLCIRWPKCWSFNFSISPSNEYSGLISFRIDWFDLLAVQVTLKSLLQHHSSKASILERSALFMFQLYFSSQLMPIPTFQLLRPKLWRYPDFPFAHMYNYSSTNDWLYISLFIFKLLFIYLSMLALRCCAQTSPSCSERGCSLVAVHRLLIVGASLVVEPRL